MKKKIRTCIIIIILLILFFPIPKGTLDDGGSKKLGLKKCKRLKKKANSKQKGYRKEDGFEGKEEN